MKKLRNILIGFVLGGAFGAKVGAYLERLLEMPASSNLMEAGFNYGTIIGSSAAVIFMIAYAVASIQLNTSNKSEKWRVATNG